MIRGLKDGLSGGELLMTERELRAELVDFQASQRLRRAPQAKPAEVDTKK